MFCDDLDEGIDTRVVKARNVGDGLGFDTEMREIVRRRNGMKIEFVEDNDCVFINQGLEKL